MVEATMVPKLAFDAVKNLRILAWNVGEARFVLERVTKQKLQCFHRDVAVLEAHHHCTSLCERNPLRNNQSYCVSVDGELYVRMPRN
jgi:hypothetical protein